MFKAKTNNVDETRQLAARLAEFVISKDLILLVGDLGAGKTAFTQGLGESLGVTDAITSPTFILARAYTGRLVLHHLDVYRIEDLDEVRDLALPELLEGDSVTVIEWGDQIVPAVPQNYLEVRLEYGLEDDQRYLTISRIGESWKNRMEALQEAVDEWIISE
ncbi:MAG: tRNA (adenosine(37)-N6)-threonylcarbamoyltransferase complex ATPase subunit type 1 TsaE [Acidimicrobiaceae bacterium]|nr:tRNA (adenosine(37)-N6)-threonylcarbamoyltransferase complex ATPase subunit type 1 TsaE [Acidimicrobiaceae bacterium]